MTIKKEFLKDVKNLGFDLAVNCLPRKGFEIYDYSHIKEELKYCVEYECWHSAKVYADALADAEGNESSYFIIILNNSLNPSLPSHYIVNTKDDVLNFIDKIEV